MLKLRIVLFAMVGFFLGFYPANIQACVVCIHAAVYSVLPIYGGWILFGIIWYIVLSWVSKYHKRKLSGIPTHPGKAILIIIILAVIGLFFLGPIPFFFLFPICVIGTMRVLLKKKEDTDFKKRVKMLGGLAITAFVILGVASYYIKANETASDYILKWNSTYQGRAAFKKLLTQGIVALPDLRAIVKKGRSDMVAEAAQRLAQIGVPAIDVPLLKEALKSFTSEYDEDERDRVKRAIQILSGTPASEEVDDSN